MKTKNILTGLALAVGLTGAANAAITAGQTVGIDFGGDTSTDPGNTWNGISVGGTATTAGMNDAASIIIGDDESLLSTTGVATGSTFTFLNSSGEIAWDFGGVTAGGADGVVGDGAFISHASVFGDGIISNDASGRVVTPTDTFTFTFSGLDDGLTYNLSGGHDGNQNNTNFDATWTADGQSATTDTSGGGNLGFISLTGLETDGSGNLVITVNGTATGASHITVNALTLTAVPEPSTTALLGLGGLALILHRRK